MLRRWLYGETAQFERFSQLPQETQVLVIGYAARDGECKSNLQVVNKCWSEVVSIKHPKIFDACCNLKHPHMSRIFLHAVYNSNYEGVENILKNSYFNKIKSPNLCYRNIYNNESGYEGVLDPYHIAREDKRMVELLEKYNVATLPVGKVPCQPTPLIMACLSGNHDAINYDIKGDKNNIRKALNIIAACDHEKCMQQLIEVLHDEFGDLFSKNEDDEVLGRKLLRRACIYKSCKVLKMLLDYGFGGKNDIVDDATILDEALKLVKKDKSFDPVVVLLKKCDAKTFQQLQENVEDEESILERCGLPF
jgi:hypothetical protein